MLSTETKIKTFMKPKPPKLIIVLTDTDNIFWSDLPFYLLIQFNFWNIFIKMYLKMNQSQMLVCGNSTSTSGLGTKIWREWAAKLIFEAKCKKKLFYYSAPKISVESHSRSFQIYFPPYVSRLDVEVVLVCRSQMVL